MKAGPKGTVKAAPLDFAEFAEDRAARRLAFIADYLRIPKGVGANKPVHLRGFQVEIVETVFAAGVLTGLAC
jgi:hypothetical protein